MPGTFLWAWDTDNDEWVKVKTDSQGRLYTVAVIDELDDIGDVYVPTPTDGYILYWNDGNSRWECKAAPVGAHKDSHDPIDGSDKLDTAAPVKVAAANAIGSSHSFSRADHVHEREHAKYTDAAAKAQAEGAKLDDHAAPDDNTDLDAAAAKHGLMPKLDKVKLDAIAALADVTADNAPKAHKASHQNGGGDKISVAGLSGVLADDQHIIDAEAVDAIEADDNLPVASITFIIDGGGSAITTGIKGDLEIPFACTINRVTMLGSPSGSIVVDIWKQAYADFPPEDAQSITASAPPTITTAEKSQDSTLTGWTTAIAAGDCLRFYVDSVTDIERVTLSLKVTKT